MTQPRRIGDLHYATDGRDILLNKPDGWEVDQPWLWWDGPADGDGTGGPFGNPPPGAELAAPSMHGTALPAVTACEQKLSDPIAGMPWKVFRGREQLETPTWISDPQALARDGRRLTAPGPDARLSAVEFWTQHIISMLRWGEGLTYTPRVLDDAGEPTGPIIAPIYNLHPWYVEFDEDEGRYYVDDPDDAAGRSYLDPRELIVTRYMLRPGRIRGLGVIQAHAADLGFAANLRTYLDNLYQRGVPNGYLKSTTPDLTKADADKLKDMWMRNHGSLRKNIGVLNATTEFHALALDPAASQFVELLRLQAWQVALMYNVPPSKLGISIGQSHNYSNLESENTAFVQDALMPIARRLESAIDAVLPTGTELKIDFNQLRRGDTSARYAGYKIGIDAGFLTIDEVRALEDLPPLPPEATPPAPGADDGGAGDDPAAEQPPADPTDDDTTEE